MSEEKCEDCVFDRCENEYCATCGDPVSHFKADYIISVCCNCAALTARLEAAEKENDFMAKQLQGDAYLAKDILALEAENTRLREFIGEITPEIEKVVVKLNEHGWLDLTVLALEAWIRKAQALTQIEDKKQ